MPGERALRHAVLLTLALAFLPAPAGAQGRRTERGRLLVRGPEAERVRAIVRELLPPGLDPAAFRAYVLENPEWNARAAPDGALVVFSGLLAALDDDELAIVLGHELAHVTHEHARRQLEQALSVQRAAAGALGAAEQLDDPAERSLVRAAALLAAAAWQNGYVRWQEGQADRIGLRYAFEAGYDVSKAKALWERFAARAAGCP